jgi:hypothetical protein
MPSALRELVALLRLKESGSTLRSALLERGAVFGPELGLSDDELRRLTDLADDDLQRALTGLVRQAHVQRSQVQSTAARELALAAAERLGANARRTLTGGFAVDVGLLLGDVLTDRHTKYVAFDVGGTEVPIFRSTLLAVRRVARPFGDLSAEVTPEALRFRWHDGQGGFNFYPQTLSRDDRKRALQVLLRERSDEQRENGNAHRSRIRCKNGNWLGDVLADLGFSI